MSVYSTEGVILFSLRKIFLSVMIFGLVLLLLGLGPLGFFSFQGSLSRVGWDGKSSTVGVGVHGLSLLLGPSMVAAADREKGRVPSLPTPMAAVGEDLCGPTLERLSGGGDPSVEGGGSGRRGDRGDHDGRKAQKGQSRQEALVLFNQVFFGKDPLLSDVDIGELRTASEKLDRARKNSEMRKQQLEIAIRYHSYKGGLPLLTGMDRLILASPQRIRALIWGGDAVAKAELKEEMIELFLVDEDARAGLRIAEEGYAVVKQRVLQLRSRVAEERLQLDISRMILPALQETLLVPDLGLLKRIQLSSWEIKDFPVPKSESIWKMDRPDDHKLNEKIKIAIRFLIGSDKYSMYIFLTPPPLEEEMEENFEGKDHLPKLESFIIYEPNQDPRHFDIFRFEKVAQITDLLTPLGFEEALVPSLGKQYSVLDRGALVNSPFRGYPISYQMDILEALNRNRLLQPWLDQQYRETMIVGGILRDRMSDSSIAGACRSLLVTLQRLLISYLHLWALEPSPLDSAPRFMPTSQWLVSLLLVRSEVQEEVTKILMENFGGSARDKQRAIGGSIEGKGGSHPVVEQLIHVFEKMRAQGQMGEAVFTYLTSSETLNLDGKGREEEALDLTSLPPNLIRGFGLEEIYLKRRAP